MADRDPFSLTAGELEELLSGAQPYIPELAQARIDRSALAQSWTSRLGREPAKLPTETVSQIPVTGYTAYRRFLRDGDRREYETPYFQKRERLSVAALQLFMGQDDMKALVQDIIWNICEETNWVLPAHEERPIDLFSAETALLLAETLSLLGGGIDAEIRHRSYAEIDQRVFEPYFRYHQSLGWYKGSNNWNGVCNSAIAAAFLWLEPNPARMAHGVALALAGLRVFLDTAFERDGSSTEGVAYWHYGLMNFVVLSEMLLARSNGAIDLLGSDKIRKIAAYPAKMLLSGSAFASFSDCHETVTFNPGIIARLSLRTGEPSLWNLIAHPALPTQDWRLTMMLRNLLWWDGTQPDMTELDDAHLPEAGVARLVASTSDGLPIVVIIKAGHNAENHNQNDVGSFIVHVDGENLLTDPGPGLYSRQYFSEQRYENVFANSYGHSVPRISGRLQGAGVEFAGRMQSLNMQQSPKSVAVTFAHAYPLNELKSARRILKLATTGEHAGAIWLQDDFEFTQYPNTVEEAFVTWCEVDCAASTAVIHGARHDCRLTIESPADASFSLETLTEQSQSNAMDKVLKRLSFNLSPGMLVKARVRIEVI